MLISQDNMMKWKHIRTLIAEEEIQIENVNIWDFPWIDTKQRIKIFDPLYHNPAILSIYMINTESKTIIFGAVEFSNGIWGIYEQEK